MDLISEIATATKQSTVAKEELERCQTNLWMMPKKLKQDVPTRWNSTFEMITRFVEVTDAISLLLLHSSMKNVGHFSPDMWEEADNVAKVLKPLYKATVELKTLRQDRRLYP